LFGNVFFQARVRVGAGDDFVFAPFQSAVEVGEKLQGGGSRFSAFHKEMFLGLFLQAAEDEGDALLLTPLDHAIETQHACGVDATDF